MNRTAFTQPVKIWTIAAIAVAGIAPSAGANLESQPQTLAQTSLVGQCRVTNRAVDFFETRGGTDPKPADTIPAQTEVILSDNGSGGLIGVSQVGGKPRNGFVPARYLYVGCKTAGTPPSTGNTCRRVVTPIGLVVHSGASRGSSVVGGVSFNERIDLSTYPATVRQETDGRRWIQIAKPMSGWVSNGYSGTNLVYCQ
jgi:hypothetical protein